MNFVLLLICFAISKSECYDVIDYTTMSNWTTCENFLANSKFDVANVTDVEWKVFYFWDLMFENSYHFRFSLPTPMLIERVSATIGNNVETTPNWTASELFMETSSGWSSILIRTNTSGRYQCITAFHLAYTFTVPVFDVGLKLVDGYLGIMNCKRRFAYGLAPIDNMPSSLEIEHAAAKIGFWNPMGRSYTVKLNNTFGLPLRPIEDLDDVRDDEEMEIKIDRKEYEAL